MIFVSMNRNFAIIIFLMIQFVSIISAEEIFKFYETEIDNIEIMTKENLITHLFNSDRLTALECYANWCGFSRMFIPQWKYFANETLLWHKRVLRVAAIDCALDENKGICFFKYDVKAYPDFRWFNAKLDSSGVVITAENETSKSEDFMRTTINLIESHKNPPEAWPYLESYE